MPVFVRIPRPRLGCRSGQPNQSRQGVAAGGTLARDFLSGQPARVRQLRRVSEAWWQSYSRQPSIVATISGPTRSGLFFSDSDAKRNLRTLVNGVLAVPPLRALARVAGRLGWLPQRVWSGYPFVGVIDVRGYGARFSYEVTPGDYVGMPIYWCGFRAYEPETLRVFSDLVRDAEVFFDIGANTGLFSLFASALNEHLQTIAFEPVPATFTQLERQIEINRWSERNRLQVFI